MKPLSPYLFILCMEYLGFLIEKNALTVLGVPLRHHVGILKFLIYFLLIILFFLLRPLMRLVMLYRRCYKISVCSLAKRLAVLNLKYTSLLIVVLI